MTRRIPQNGYPGGEVLRQGFRDLIRTTIGYNPRALNLAKLELNEGRLSCPELLIKARDLAARHDTDHVAEVGALLLASEPNLKLANVGEVYLTALRNAAAYREVHANDPGDLESNELARRYLRGAQHVESLLFSPSHSVERGN